MIRPGVVPYATVDGLVRVSCPFGAELPYRPVIRVFGVEEGDEAVQWVAVGSLGVCLAWSRAGRKRCTVSLRVVRLQGQCVEAEGERGWNSRYNDVVGHVAKVQSRLGVFGSRACDDLPQQGRHTL